jgi:hypothetical protein
MRDRFGDEIEEELPSEITAPEEPDDFEEENPPEEWMSAHCEWCDDNGIRLNQLGVCDHIDYGAIARRHLPAIKQMLKKGSV